MGRGREGREEGALAAFDDAVGYYGRCQQEGRSEGFDAVFLDRNGSGLDGYFQVHGTADQIHAMREDAEFRRMVAASFCVDDMRVIDGRTGAAIAAELEMFQSEIAKVGAPAG